MGLSLLLFALCWLVPCLHPWCYAFVLLSSSAAATNLKLFELGTSRGYLYKTTVRLNDSGEVGKTVGYQVIADVGVSVVWEYEKDKLIQFEVNSPQLYVKSRKVSDNGEFESHKSPLNSFSNAPFLVQWKEGVISKVFISAKEDPSLKNLKKGIASLFQFQLLNLELEEIDSSGTCKVSYHNIDPYTTVKTKEDCQAPKGVPYINEDDVILSTVVKSKRSAVHTMSSNQGWLESVSATEEHTIAVAVKKDAGGSLISTQDITTVTDKTVKLKKLKSSDLQSAVKEFEKWNRITIAEETLNAQIIRQTCSKNDCPSLPKLVKENREHLYDTFLGTVKSANAFIKLLDAGRTATKDELTKAFKGAKNKEIMLQLCDLAGSINTLETHEIINKVISLEKEDDANYVERYLWALATGSHPKIEIIKDILKLSQRPIIDPKVEETLLLTLSTLVRKFRSLPGRQEHIINDDVTNLIMTGLEECKEESCKHKYLRALRNLLCPKTIPILLLHALKGKTITSVEAMKTIRAFKPEFWNADVIDASQRVYYQAGKKYDSSARTLAIDILLESNPREEILYELVESLLDRDPVFEVKQYLSQRLQQLSFENKVFGERVKKIRIALQDKFNNYDTQASRGLTTAFTRHFANNTEWSGSLVNVQEVSGGLLKRGIVDVVLSTHGTTSTMFTLGLFAGGLGSFVSSSDSKSQDAKSEETEEEVATAGMELSVLGSRVRPFVFFSGQGELMGHVWSGTASEKTPAYQAFIMTHDHLEHIVLQNGLVSQLQVLGAVSFDLSGQIQMSIWNRNAHSLVEQNAGVSLQGRIQVDNSFVKSQLEFSLSTEVKLNLISDLDFYDGVKLCMQLIQPDAVLRHNVHKIERIIGSKHRLRVSKYKKINLPGKTYVLNQKNNEMCNLIFKK